MVPWVLAGLAILLALAALAASRRQAQRLDALNQAYWELRYDYTRLRAQVTRLAPEVPADETPPAAPPPVSFVPLSAVRKKDR